MACRVTDAAGGEGFNWGLEGTASGEARKTTQWDGGA